MKEDILEQLVDDYLKAKGYFTRHNIKFRPEKGDSDFNVKTDSVNSDIDVLAINPIIFGPRRVIVVTCKSWQDGLRPEKLIDAFNRDLKISGRPAWKGFREITRENGPKRFVEKCIKQQDQINFCILRLLQKLLVIRNFGRAIKVFTNAKWESN